MFAVRGRISAFTLKVMEYTRSFQPFRKEITTMVIMPVFTAGIMTNKKDFSAPQPSSRAASSSALGTLFEIGPQRNHRKWDGARCNSNRGCKMSAQNMQLIKNQIHWRQSQRCRKHLCHQEGKQKHMHSPCLKTAHAICCRHTQKQCDSHGKKSVNKAVPQRQKERFICQIHQPGIYCKIMRKISEYFAKGLRVRFKKKSESANKQGRGK